MAEKLRRGGIRLRSPVVDVTNFVLLELGQPMHAFDLSKIEGSIDVRYAKNENIELLDETSMTCDEDTLVIADNKKILAMAGIMGGMKSAVSESTKDILLESAWFNPGLSQVKQENMANIPTRRIVLRERRSEAPVDRN